jgi:hypothetical protein
MHMRLAFKAQSQSRAAIETLAEIKNPRQVTFFKQANIAGGNQQVNNGTLESTPSKERSIIGTPVAGREVHRERLTTGGTQRVDSG